MLRATPYTPVFPPSLRIPSSPASGSTSCDSSAHIVNEDLQANIKKSYVGRLKERYILLASMPQDELCPPSREASPEAENRIEGLRLRMRAARELRFPHDPALTLVCSGVRGGDWVGESRSDEDRGSHVLPDTEEEWFRWELQKKATRERRLAERMAQEHRQKIAQWSEEIEDAPVQLDLISPQASQQQVDESDALRFPIVKHDSAMDKITTSRYFTRQSPGPPSRSSQRDDSEPVERLSLTMPPAPALDPLPDFSDSFSMPNSPPSLPQLPPDITFHDEVPPPPSFALMDVQTSTPHRRNPPHNPVFQLSSPVSPPRSLHPLTALRAMSTKRPREGAENEPDSTEDVMEEPTTPRSSKKARTLIEPITPASVPRQNASQEQTPSPRPRHLPTLTALLASSKRASRDRSRAAGTPRRNVAAIPEFSPSQPNYSRFLPQFQSTQPRARSLPPSPSQPMTSTPPISPQKSLAGMGSSYGMGYYQSQFNVEGKIHEVAKFLNADVSDVEA